MAIFNSNVDLFFNSDFAVDAIYKPFSGNETTIKVIFDQEQALDNYTGSTVNDVSYEIEVKSSDIPNLSKKDYFQIGNYEYQVKDILPDNEGIKTVILMKPQFKLYPLTTGENELIITNEGDLMLGKVR